MSARLRGQQDQDKAGMSGWGPETRNVYQRAKGRWIDTLCVGAEGDVWQQDGMKGRLETPEYQVGESEGSCVPDETCLNQQNSEAPESFFASSATATLATRFGTVTWTSRSPGLQKGPQKDDEVAGCGLPWRAHIIELRRRGGVVCCSGAHSHPARACLQTNSTDLTFENCQNLPGVWIIS